MLTLEKAPIAARLSLAKAPYVPAPRRLTLAKGPAPIRARFDLARPDRRAARRAMRFVHMLELAGLDFEGMGTDEAAEKAAFFLERGLVVSITPARFYMRGFVLPVWTWEASELENYMELVENYTDYGPDEEWADVEDWHRVSGHEFFRLQAEQRAALAIS